jgi:hypothetical protein
MWPLWFLLHIAQLIDEPLPKETKEVTSPHSIPLKNPPAEFFAGMIVFSSGISGDLL